MRRSLTLSGRPGFDLITNDLGEYVIVTEEERRALEESRVANGERYFDYEARGMLRAEGPQDELAKVVKRTRKAFLMQGPSLHIFVVTLRCDHSCEYCQVSRVPLSRVGYDLSIENSNFALDRVFESESPELTIEFQGGEPALRFDLIRHIVAAAENRNLHEKRRLHFSMATTLHLLTQSDLEFCRDHGIHISTSFDGPRHLHSPIRRIKSGDSWERTVTALARARAIVGNDAIAALPTVTRQALGDPEALVDAYVEMGFRSIFLRPLAPYGFARATKDRLGYTMAEFMVFYQRALEYILRLNSEGVEIEETMAAIMLRHILTPFHSGYMDLRSPAAAGLGVLVYNYDGRVFPTDEARMAAATGDERFLLGTVTDSLDALLNGPVMRWLATGAIAESQATCRSCAFVPYCGADPVFHSIAQGDPAADRAGTDFCTRHYDGFQVLFAKMHEAEPETVRTFTAWAMGRPRADIHSAWIER